MKLRIVPYNRGSKGARMLRDAIQGALIVRRPEVSRWRPRGNHAGLNWGCSQVPREWEWGCGLWLNRPFAVEHAANKLNTYHILERENIPTVPNTQERETAQEWVNSGATVLARSTVTGSTGRGITICQSGEVPDALVWTRHLRHKREYRIHVFQGEVIDVTQKRLSRDTGEGSQTLIRSHQNGWVFCRNDMQSPREASVETAIKAVEALSLDFGAVDLVEKDIDNSHAVLEINTAPGLEGTTLEKYVEALENAAQNHHI